MSASQWRGDYAARVAVEKSIYQDCADVHKLPEIFHYWSNRYVKPKLEAFGFSSPDAMFGKYLGEHCARRKNQAMRVASIGAGNCNLELELALQFRAEGCSNFTIDCLELNPAMLERGRAAAEQRGMTGHLNFLPVDLNAWRAEHEYDAVIANHTLHHILNLENLFDQVRNSVRPGGCFVISDMIGRNGHQRWPEALEIVEEFWSKLPPSYRFNQKLQRYEESYENFDYSLGSFEGIRAQDILPLLLERFHFEFFVGFANVIDPFLDAFGNNFDATSACDRDFIDQIHRRDEEEIAAGRLKPTHMLAVVGNNPAIPLKFHAPLTPQFCVRDAARVSQTDRGAQKAYAWQPLRHSIQDELEIACRRLKESAQRTQELSAQVEERTLWALGLEQRLEQRTGWALQLEQELEQRTAQAARLRQEVEESNRELQNRTAWALRLDEELAVNKQKFEERTRWALRLDEELAERTHSVQRLNEELAESHQTLEERTQWALRLDRELQQLNAELARLGWARAIDGRFRKVLRAVGRAVLPASWH